MGSSSVASHACKNFVRLCMFNPVTVKETAARVFCVKLQIIINTITKNKMQAQIMMQAKALHKEGLVT